MKNIFAVLVLCCLFIVCGQSKVYAFDITVGATTWYSWWDLEQKGQSYNIDPTFLYGPALSVRLNDDFNLTFVFLYGKFDMEESHWDNSTPPVKEFQKFKLKRYDSDLALNYRLNEYFKVFAGVKYINYSFATGGHMEHTGFGPGLGLSCAFPIVDNLFLLGTLSGFYLWAEEEDDGKNGRSSRDSKDYGINSNLSLAYYIAQASTTVSLGGRFQYMKIDKDKRNDNDSGNQTAKFYGVTLTATYTFGF